VLRSSWLFVLASLALAVGGMRISRGTDPPDGGPVGLIRGEATDSSGTPISGAKVYCERPGLVTKVTPTITDGNGKFEISGLAVGTYLVFASKEEAGFPDTFSSFYADRPEQVALSQTRPAANVVVGMPPRAGELVGTVTDARSGEPIAGAQVRLARSGDPNRFLQFASGLKDGRFDVLIPAGRGIDVSVSAGGYQTWDSHIGPVKPGAETDLRISLQGGYNGAP
jgi:large repetitive protein